MKNILFFSILLFFAVACSKNSQDEPGPNPGLELSLPGDYVFTKDESIFEQDPSVAKYTYIYTNKSAMFRKLILKSYPLAELVKEKHILFTINEDKCSGSKKCYTVNLTQEPKLFLSVGLSTNKEEVHLYISSTGIGEPDGDDIPSGEDYSKFYFHKMKDVQGIRTYAIESAGMPGWYISDSPPGFNYAQNVVTLQKEKSPDDAPKWQLRKPI